MERKTVRVYADDYIDLKKIIRKLQYEICTDAIGAGTKVLSSNNPKTRHAAQALINNALALLPKP